MPKSPAKNDSDSPRPKKRRWKRIFLILFLLVGVLGLAVNGPIARWAVGRILSKQLAKQGLAGDVTVEGRLWSGFTLKEAEFDGGANLVRLKFDELGVRYSLPELREKKIRTVHGRGLEIVISPKEKEVEKESKKPEFDKIAESLRKIRSLLTPIALDFEHFDIQVKRPDKEALRFTFESLTHPADDPEFHLRGFASNALGAQGLPPQDLTLTWTQNELNIGAVEVLPALALGAATLTYPVEAPCALTATVRAGGAELALSSDETGTISLTMDEGPLRVKPIVEPYNPDLLLDGTISRLQVTARNLWEGTDTWTARIDLEGSDLKWPGGGELGKLALRLTGDQDLSLTASAGESLSLEASAPRPVIKDRPLGSIWKDLLVSLTLQTPSLHQTLRDVFVAIGAEPLDLANIPEGVVTIEGTLTTGGELGVAPADLKWTFSDIVLKEKSIPNLAGTAGLANGVAGLTTTLAQPRPEESLQLIANWTLASKSYEASLLGQLPDPAWIKPFLPGESPDWQPTGPIAATWKGAGSFPTDAEPTHTGELKLAKLSLTAPEDTTTEISLEGIYAWPGMVELTSLSARNGDLWLEGALKWDDDRLQIRTLRFHDQTGPLTNLDGSLPLALDALSAEDYLSQDDTLELNLTGRDLRLRRIATLIPLKLPEGFSSTLDYNLTVAGTPGSPQLSGTITASEVRLPGPEELPLLTANLNFATADQRLRATGTITEPGGKLVDLSATLPIRLKEWVDDPERFKQLALEANATVSQFALDRLQLFAPPLATAEGTIEAAVKVSGTIGAPVLNGQATVNLKRYPLPGTPFQSLRDSKLVVRLEGSQLGLEGSQLVVDPSTVIRCAGGSLSLRGSVRMEEKTPQFDLKLVADHLLAWRDDSLILRCNADLGLTGPLDAAQLSGSIDFVESLFYKEIELIPIGAPTVNVPKPKLPKFDQEQTAKIGGIPSPFGDWGLNLVVRTVDPVLIRGGNFATGKVNADLRVRGTLSNPRPSGTVSIQDAWAKLPLAGKLNISQGIVTFRPDAPFNPLLEARGSATVDRRNITLNIYGSANNPKYSLFSDPPLPESEILTLLATGTTTGDLEGLDRDAATMKGAQFAINWIKSRLEKPGKDSWVQSFLTELDEVELNVGENDPFSGRKLNSATLQVADNWFLSAAVDATGNTRGVVIFSVRFR